MDRRIDVMVGADGSPADVEWPLPDPWRTAAGWVWLGYFTAHALLGVWLLS
jgi:hypothetical protein